MATLSDFEEIVAALHSELAVADLDYGILRLAQSQHAAARRVVWIPISFDTKPVDHSQPVRHPETGAPAIYAEMWAIEAHIVGETLADAELLRARLVDVTRRLMGVASVPTGGLWVTQAIAGASHGFGGLEKVVQRFNWTMYMFAPPPAAGSVTTVKRIDTRVALGDDPDDAATFREPSEE